MPDGTVEIIARGVRRWQQWQLFPSPSPAQPFQTIVVRQPQMREKFPHPALCAQLDGDLGAINKLRAG